MGRIRKRKAAFLPGYAGPPTLVRFGAVGAYAVHAYPLTVAGGDALQLVQLAL